MSEGPNFDPTAQFAQFQAWMQQWMMNPLNPMKSGFIPSSFRYEAVNPIVQEISILALMHNMASMLEDPAAIKDAINDALAERTKRLAAQKS